MPRRTAAIAATIAASAEAAPAEAAPADIRSTGVGTTVHAGHELHVLLETAADVVSRGSNQGVIDWISPSVTQVLGWAPSEVLGQRFINLVHPDDHDTVRDVQHALIAGRPCSMDVRLQTNTGTSRWMSIRVRPILDADGTVVGRAAAWRDIQAEVDAHTLTLAAIDALRTAVDSLPDPYVIVVAERDPSSGAVVDFTIGQANVAACRFMQWPHPLPAGIRVLACMDAEPAAMYVALGARVLATGEPLIIDRAPVGNGPGGAIRHYDARGVRIDADRVGFTWRDVSDQVEHDRTVTALATMEAIVDERERVARDLHDGAIQHVYATGMLLQSMTAGATPDRQRELERVIAEQALIVDELRATIRGLLRPDLVHLTPADSLRRIVDDAAQTLGFGPSLVGCAALDTLDDPALLQHLLYATREMLSNVARHAAATAVDVTVQVTDTDVTVEVADNGVGAAPSGRAGERSPTATTTGSSGGFGITNLQRRAQVLGGSFELTARLPAGTLARWNARR